MFLDGWDILQTKKSRPKRVGYWGESSPLP